MPKIGKSKPKKVANVKGGKSPAPSNAPNRNQRHKQTMYDMKTKRKVQLQGLSAQQSAGMQKTLRVNAVADAVKESVKAAFNREQQQRLDVETLINGGDSSQNEGTPSSSQGNNTIEWDRQTNGQG